MATTLTTNTIYGLTTSNSGSPGGSLVLFIDVDISGSPAPNGTLIAVRTRSENPPGSGIYPSSGQTFSSAIATIGGFAIFQISFFSSGGSNREYQALEDTGGATSTWTPNGAPIVFDWDGAGAVPDYEPGSPALTAIPGDTKNVLVWTDSTPIDPISVPQNHVYIDHYVLHRSTTAGFTPSASSWVAAGGGTRIGSTTPPVVTFLDTGRTNGTTYYYRVVAAQNITFASFGPSHSTSNEANATPRAGKEYWGAVVRA